ncbi:DUF6011 domain-containing protein [Flavobacterium sp.]|jgi:hypothetical protein|uniref:DUF6011 domain-containing protein n=1 Tax=Flavobacterium sp. TaxID=239 RepID=UPI0022BCF61E|nr:DUF6011 domain-containing protein [Flavobacterium sp.]MCZ8144388.1 DUF6011 domain-containing protein [Flavobacterium sp.]MCZ8367956.1 DUF6011 domain-containing protein [Flavobacterium sp.]
MKRISQICKELNIRIDELISLLHSYGFVEEHLNLNTRVPNELFEKIKAIYNNEVTEKVSTNVYEESLCQTHSFEKVLVEIALERNTLEDREVVLKSFDGYEVSTLFKDEEAFLIALGIEDKSVRSLANRYFQSKYITGKQFITVHRHAMAALDRYGGAFITHIMALPKLPFKALDAHQLFSELDRRKSKLEFPIVRFAYKNQDGVIEHLQMMFDSHYQSKQQIRNNHIIVVKNKSTGSVLFKIDRDGYVLPVSTKNKIVPILQYFIQVSRDTGTFVLNYGLETGFCSRCGRMLSDKESLRIGMGPSCRQYG